MIPKYFAVKKGKYDSQWENYILWLQEKLNAHGYFSGRDSDTYYGIGNIKFPNKYRLQISLDKEKFLPDTQFFESAEEFMKLINEKPKKEIKDIISPFVAISVENEAEAAQAVALFEKEGFKVHQNNLNTYKSNTKGVGIYNRAIWYRSYDEDSQFTYYPLSYFLPSSNTKQMNYTISREGMEEIYNIACSSWKKKIESWTKPFGDTTLTKEQVDEMFSAANESQKKVLNKYFKRELTLDDILKGREHFQREGYHNYMMSVRGAWEYKNKGYWLNSEYNWEIKKDSNNQMVLIPTLKS